MATETATLPPLSPRERTLLAALLDTSLSLPQIAQKLGLDDFLDIVLSPAVRDALRAITEFNHLRAAAISSGRRIVSLLALADIAETAKDPIERRRAASTFLRALTPALPQLARALPDTPARSEPRHATPPPPQTRAEPARQHQPAAPASPLPAAPIPAPLATATLPVSPLDLPSLLNPAPNPSPQRPRRPSASTLAAAAGGVPTG